MSGPGIDLKSDIFRSAVDSIVLRAEKHRKDGPHYVDSGQISKLSAIDNQFGYGRRGTGKTHLLDELANKIEKSKDALSEVATIIDLQRMSTAPIDRPWIANPFSAALEIFKNIISDIAESYCRYLEKISTIGIPADRTLSDKDAYSILTKMLESLSGNYSKPESATIESEFGGSQSADQSASASIGLTANQSSIDAKAGLETTKTVKNIESSLYREKGESLLQLPCHEIVQAAEHLNSGLNINRFWLLLDEWSSIPQEVQPYLADLIRRTFSPSPQFTIKVMCLPHKTNFSVTTAGTIIGFDVGGDIFPGIDLDDILIYNKAPETVESVFAEILYSHLTAVYKPPIPQLSSNNHAFINSIFSDKRAFIELIKASEGNPRDFLHIFVAAYRITVDVPEIIAIGIPAIRSASGDWYERDKRRNLSTEHQNILTRLISEVIKERQSKLFLVRQEKGDAACLRELQHARLLHRWHRGYAAKSGETSERYDVFAIDYGAYVDLRATSIGRQIQEDIFSENGEYEIIDDNRSKIEVPDPDKRRFRHIVLPDELLDDFNQMIEGAIECPHCRSKFSPRQKSYIVRRLCPECFKKVDKE